MELIVITASVLSAVFVGISTFVAYRMWRSSSRSQIEEDGKWKGRVDTLLERIGEDLERMGKELERVGKELAELRQIVFSRFSIPVTTHKSPLRLSDFGETISKEITAQAWVERVADSLDERIKGMDAYEIQELCFQYVESTNEYSNEEKQVIRDSAYKRGVKTKDIRRVLAIELRDKLLKNTGIEPPE